MIGVKKTTDNKSHNHSLRQKLLFFQGSVLLVLFAGITVYLITVYSNSLLKLKQEEILTSLQYINNNISAQLETIELVDIDVRVSSVVKDNLNQTEYVEYGRAFSKIVNYLSTKIFGAAGLRHAVIIDKENHVYSVDFTLQLPKDFRIEETEVYKAALNNPSKLVWLSNNDIYDNYGIEHGDYRMRSDIHAASIIKNYSSGETLGLLILTLNQNYFQELMKTEKVIENANIFLVSPDKTKEYALTAMGVELEPGILNSLRFAGIMGTIQHGQKLIIYEPNKEMDWYIVCVADMQSLQHSVQRYILPLLIVFGLTLLLFFAVTNRFFNPMTRGIDNLTDQMRRFEKGDFSAHVENPGNDEIGRLSRSFNHMVDRIEELLNSQYQLALKTREAEFKSLQAQINPHFLYNTLDMLNWQLVMCGQENLSQGVVAIGNCLRYSISQGTIQTTLKEEMDNVRDYIAVQKRINEKQVDVFLDVDEPEKIVLPKLTLQPLVENAFLHGFIGREENNSLAITGIYSSESKNEYIITVSDNGIGMNDEEHPDFNASGKQSSSAHVGLGNVISRVKYLYREKADIKIDSKYGVGTSITISLNLEPEDEG